MTFLLPSLIRHLHSFLNEIIKKTVTLTDKIIRLFCNYVLIISLLTIIIKQTLNSKMLLVV